MSVYLGILPTVLDLVLALLSVSLGLAFIRLFRGPSLPDRVVALELIGVLAVGIISAYAIFTDEPVFLRVAIVLGLVAFVGTVAFAYYLEKRGSTE